MDTNSISQKPSDNAAQTSCPNCGVQVDATPINKELLEALEYLEKEATLLRAHASCDDCTNHSVHGALAKARAAIKAAKGDA